MRLALVFDKDRADTVGVYFERACQQLGIPYAHWQTKDAHRIPAEFDAYLRIDHGDYAADLPATRHPCAFFAIDTHLRASWNSIQRQARHYDVVYCAQRQAAGRLGGVWVPLACDPQLHGPVEGVVQWDVACVGTEGGVPRKFYLQALRERYPNSFIGHAPHTELGAIYSRAKIGFNYAIRDDVNMRVFEVLASGALLVTNALGHDDLAQLGLTDGVHYVGYRRPQELWDVLDYYLSHDAPRAAIAQAGMTVAHQRHTYQHRLRQMLDGLAKRPDAMSAANRDEVSQCKS